MGIMTGLLGCCSSSTLGSRANDYVKTLTLGFWLHHLPCSLGCWTNNTLAAQSLSPKYSLGLLQIALYIFWTFLVCGLALTLRQTTNSTRSYTVHQTPVNAKLLIANCSNGICSNSWNDYIVIFMVNYIVILRKILYAYWNVVLVFVVVVYLNFHNPVAHKDKGLITLRDVCTHSGITISNMVIPLLKRSLLVLIEDRWLVLAFFFNTMAYLNGNIYRATSTL